MKPKIQMTTINIIQLTIILFSVLAFIAGVRGVLRIEKYYQDQISSYK